MATQLTVKVKGLDKLDKALQAAPGAIQVALADAATLIGDHVLNTPGLRAYPPEGSGNLPPTPYWIRGVGRQTSASRNLNDSEKLGSRFYSLGEVMGPLSVVVRIGNTASYAPYVVGDQQSKTMAKIGWRKLSDVAIAKLAGVGKILEAVLNATFKRIGL